MPHDLASHPVDLDQLIGTFYRDSKRDGGPLGRFTLVDDIAATAGSLLNHQHHMTVTVEKHYGCPVDVVVHRYDQVDGRYVREITLVEQCNGKPVQYGIVRLDPGALDPPVWRKIESRQIPLGRVLIDHDVLREVELKQLWRIESGPALADYLNIDDRTIVYGRTALIRCDRQPAIELLEIIAPV
ncbi:MAG: hypothetical protein AAF958_07920 [Planctomycetota bacterium]